MARWVRKFWPPAALLGAAVLAAPAAGAEYRQQQGPAEIRLGAEVDREGRAVVRLSGADLAVRVRGRAPLQVTWDQPVRSEGWAVQPLDPPRQNPEKTLWERQFRLKPPAKTGDLSLEFNPLKFRAGGRPEQAVTWKPVRVWVPKPSLTQLRPRTPPEEVPPAPSWHQPLAWAGLALVLAALGLVAWELVRRRFRRSAALTPDRWALAELDKVAVLDLSVADEVERFPTLLSDVLRRYLELRFRLRATRQTTAEFLEAMKEAPQLTEPQQAMLRKFLNLCDLAKFARETLSVEQSRALVQEARGFVEQTAGPHLPHPFPQGLAQPPQRSHRK